MAGYSGTPLAKKLGINPGSEVALLNAPGGLAIDGMPEGVTPRHDLRGSAPLDVVVLFTAAAAGLPERFAEAAARLAPTGGLWVGWPKRASGVPTDLTEDIVRTIGLDAGLVDNKVCAIDETWSGLRFVRRLRDRATPPSPPSPRRRRG